MKFILGVVVGIAGLWLYRARGQQTLARVPEFAQQARETVTTMATTGAQRAAQVINKGPLSPQVKDVASGMVNAAQESSTEHSESGTPSTSESEKRGVEAAEGNSTQDGDVAPKLSTL